LVAYRLFCEVSDHIVYQFLVELFVIDF
jgi:hypothetical protein